MPGHVGVRYHDKAAKGRTCVCGDYRFEFGYVPNERRVRINSKERSGGSQGAQVIFGRRCCVEWDKDPSNTWRNFLEQLKPLAAHRRLANGEAGDVPARPRKARNEAFADRIGNDCENDWDGARLLKQCLRILGVLRKK